ncbi:putative isochorismatase [mine drainage metagenome]|uniref:Putative isochorismatase n=1 Tax=mine drainage metagenome TaxID=410659 RepID=A0A1J5R1M6_9ZZZZ
MLLTAAQSGLLIVDVQEKLAPVMSEPRRVLQNCGLLLRAAARLGVPALVSEQYPRGIGPTVVDLRQWIGPEAIAEKIHFSCADEPALLERLGAWNRPQLVVAGIEAHICVLQTALGLAARGFRPFVVADACASRQPSSEALAMDRLRQAGVAVVSTEMVLFEWLNRAGTPEFKELSPLIR